MFQFNALIPQHSLVGVVDWHGFNSEGTHAFGTQYYNGYNRVKVYRAGILGSIHEIADIHFPAITSVSNVRFYSKTNELVWLYEIDGGYLAQMCSELDGTRAEFWYTLVVFNVVTGQLKRYYARIPHESHVGDYWEMSAYLIPAEDDVPVMMVLASDTHTLIVKLCKFFLNHADETFSIELLIRLSSVTLTQKEDIVYTHSHLIHKARTNFDRLFSFKFKTKEWSMEIVEFDGEKPFPFENHRLGFDGHSLTYIDVSSDITIFHLDVQELRWKKVKVFRVYHVPVLQLVSYRSTLISCNLQLACTFTQKFDFDDDFVDVLITVYHCENQLPRLKDQCIRVLLSYVAKFRQDLSDHDVCKLLSLEMIAQEYCGRLFL